MIPTRPMKPSHDPSVSRNIETGSTGPLGRQRGFALLAATGAALVVSLMVAAWYHRELGELEKAKVDSTRDIIIATAEVLYSWRLENNNTWPSSMSDLSALAPVLAANARNGVGQLLELDAPTPPNHPTLPIVIRTDLLDARLAAEVRSEFPGQARAGTTSVVEIEIPIPGHEPGDRVQELLVRDGTRDMAGDLNLGGNDIEDVDRFLINERLVIGGEVLDRDRARFLVRLAGLNCSPDQLLAISGGVPSCVAWSPTDTLPPPTLPPAVPGVSITGGSAVTEGGNAVFTLRPTVPFSSAATVALSVSDDASADFVAAGDEGRKTVTFPGGTSSVTWTVPTVDDAIDEPDGQVTARVLSGSGYVPYAPESASVGISDNDCPGTPSPKPVISIGGHGAIVEGRRASFTIRANRTSASAVSVSLDVSDDASGDFLAASAEGRKTVSLPAGGRSATYAVLTENDSVDEPDGIITVRIVGSPCYTIGSRSASIIVRDNDSAPSVKPVITIAGGSAVTEGGNAVFTLRASRASTTAISVSLDVSDDSTSDFLASSSEGHRSVTLPAGATTVRYSVPTVDDTTDEPDGRVTVRITGRSSYTTGIPSSAYVSVRDNDAPLPAIPAITITGGSAVTEGGTAAFTLRASRASATAISVSLDVSDDAASDFLASTSEGRKSVTLPAGARSATYSVRTEDDSADEPDGQVSARIASGSGYTAGSPSSATVAVHDNDAASPVLPVITIRGGVSVTEGGNAVFTVTADRTSTAAITIGLNVSDDATSDYLASSTEGPSTVTLPAGSTIAMYSVPTIDDTNDEPDGQVSARITGGSGFTTGSPSSAIVTVRDNDAAPPSTPEISIRGGVPVTEGGNAVFTLEASLGSAAPIVIGLTVSDDATSDFLASSVEGPNAVTLPARHTVVTYSVPTVDDANDEPDGQVGALIAVGSGYTVGSRSSASVTVRDNDAAPPPVCPRPDDLDPRAGWNASTCTAFCGAETWDYSMGIRVSVGVTQRRGLDYASYSHTQPGDCSDSSVYNINELLFFADSGSSCGIWSIYEVVGPNGANFYGRNIQQPQQYTLPHLNPLILTCGPRLCFSLSSEIINRCGARR